MQIKCKFKSIYTLLLLLFITNGITLIQSSQRSSAELVITVKTTAANHFSRLARILDSWHQFAPDDTYFVTDEDANLPGVPGGHLLNSKCGTGHKITSLCCKMATEIGIALQHNVSWWCHFDDDNYVNVPSLRAYLKKLNADESHYLGRPSTRDPVRFGDEKKLGSDADRQFWFGTGGAGICLSKSALKKLRARTRRQRFERTCQVIGLPDDVTLGYIMEYLLKVPLKRTEEFHSHMEELNYTKVDELKSQISFGMGAVHLRRRKKTSKKWKKKSKIAPNSAPSYSSLDFRQIHKIILN